MTRHKTLPKHVNGFVDRHGRPRFYLRRKGCKAVALPGMPWTPEFMAAYYAVLAETETQPIAKDRYVTGSVNSAVLAFYGSGVFAELRPSTQAKTKWVLERFRAVNGEKTLAGLKRIHLDALLEQVAIGSRRDWFKAVRGLVRFALDKRLISIDPTAGMNVAKPIVKAENVKVWSEADIDAFRAYHPLGSIERLSLELLLNSGARGRSDATRLGWRHIEGSMIKFTAAKNGSTVAVPILSDFAAALALVPRNRLIFIVGAKGLPMDGSSFGRMFREAVIAAGLDAKLTPHGLRRAFATRLADQGCNEITIAAALGDRNLEAARAYVREVNAGKLVAGGFAAVADALKQKRAGTKP